MRKRGPVFGVQSWVAILKISASSLHDFEGMSQEYRLSRRQLLAAGIVAPFCLAAVQASANAPRQRDWRAVLLDRDRYLDLERPQAGEKATFYFYRKNQGWDAQGYQIACSLLRDVVSKKTVSMDLKLLDLLWIISAYLRMHGMPAKILINSGYRTPEFNRSLEGAARNSMHIQAKAADIQIPGVTSAQLSDLAKVIGVGGVGIYPSKGFVHVDIGKIRTWRGALVAPYEDSWLAGFSNHEVEQRLALGDMPGMGQIVYV